MSFIRLEGSTKRPLVPQVRAAAALPFIGFLEALGAPVDRFLAAAKLSPTMFENPEGLVPFWPVLVFLDRAAQREGIENLGLLVGENTSIDQLGALGRVILRSATLSEALTAAGETITTFNSAERIWLVEEHDHVLFCHTLVSPEGRDSRHADLFAITLMIKIVRLALGRNWWPRQIRLPKAEFLRKPYYQERFPTELVFHDDPAYAIVIERRLLAHAVTESSSLEACPQDDLEFLRSSAPAFDLDGSVRQAIGALLPSGYPDVRFVADTAGLSMRSFQRRLAEMGSKYSHLVEQVRFETATRLLREDRLKLIDIAYELGYTDAANFTRAFRQWTGFAPSEYRRLALAGEIPMPPDSARP